ncbi:MAG TPA: recombinase family protein [Phycisphaerales bacterium]|nr:recombinase family protein [Phycisphaerales bacterium]
MRQNGTAAVGYARRSTDMQERSIPDQQAYVERWARLNGYRVIRWYIDDAISGTSAKGRAQFERLMHDAENGRDFEAVLCYDMSRFSRGGTNETGYYLHRLSIAGVQALFCADGIPDGEEGELLQGVKSWQARQYSVKLSRDCIRGQHSTVTVRRSGMGGRAPYGYDRQYVSAEGRVIRTVRTLPDGRRQEFGPDGKHVRFIDACQPMGRKMKSDIVRLVPGDPRQVKAVRMMFDMCAKGFGFRSIVIALNDRGISGPMRSRWNQMAVKTILQNPCYYGALVWNRRTFGKIHGVSPDGTARTKRPGESTRNPRDRWIIIDDVHEPLVSRATFDAAQEAMAKRRNAGGLARPTQRYLLSGLLKCTNCGYNLWGCIVKNGSDVGVRYYVDAGYRAQGIKVCRSTSISVDALDSWVLARVRELLPVDAKGREAAVKEFLKAMSQRRTSGADTRSRDDELASVSKRMKALAALLADEDVSDIKELRDELVALKRRRTMLEAEAAKDAEDKIGRVDIADLRMWAEAQLKELTNAIGNGGTMHEMRQVVHALVDRIEIDPHAKKGVMYLPANAQALLEAAATSRVRVPSSSHSCSVLVAARCGSPR